MKLGLNVGYWGLGITPEQQLEMVTTAEEAGYDSVWSAEAYGSDAATVLGWLAGKTSRIRIGSGIFRMPARHPSRSAMCSRRSEQRPHCRLIRSAPTSSRCPAARRTSSRSSCCRRWRATGIHSGSCRCYQLPLPDGPGKALKLMISPIQERIPIFIAAIGPKNTALTGEIADGWIPFMYAAEHAEEIRRPLEEGLARAGRTLDDIEIAPTVNVCIDDDIDRARDVMRPFLALYVGGMGSRKQNFYNAMVRRYGFEDAAREVQDLYLDGKKEEAAAKLPPELIDMVCIVGPKDRVRERLSMLRDAGVGTLLTTAFAIDMEERKRMIRELAELL